MSQKDRVAAEVISTQQWISTYGQRATSSKTLAEEVLQNNGDECAWPEKFDGLVSSADFSWKSAVEAITRSYPEGYIESACIEYERGKETYWREVLNVLQRASQEEEFHAPAWNSRVDSDFVLSLFACLDATTRDVVVYKEKNIFCDEIANSIATSSWRVEKCIEVCLAVYKSKRQLICTQIQDRLHRHSEGELAWGISHFLRLASYYFGVVQKFGEIKPKKQKKLRVAFIMRQLLPLYKRTIRALPQLDDTVKWFVGGDTELIVCALRTICQEVRRPSHHVNSDWLNVIHLRFDCIRRLTISLTPAEASAHAAEVFACLRPLWSSESTLRAYKCLCLLVDKTFQDLYGQHFKTHAPDLKASVLGFLGDQRGCDKYQVTCYEVFAALYLEGSDESERQKFSSNYARQLEVALFSRRLYVTYDWMVVLLNHNFRQTVLSAVIKVIPDFEDWLKMMCEADVNSALDLSGHEEKIVAQLYRDLTNDEYDRLWAETRNLRWLCSMILDFLPRNVARERVTATEELTNP